MIRAKLPPPLLPSPKRPRRRPSFSVEDRGGLSGWKKDAGRKQAAGLSLGPPKNGRGQRTTTSTLESRGLFWVRHEHCREREKVKNLDIYKLLTPSEIPEVFMGKTLGTFRYTHRR